MINPNQTAAKGSALTTILLAGFLVGSLDILSAFVDYYIATGKGPQGILRYVASGAFGKEAFTGGTGMVLWGLFFHYIIAFSFTLLFYWLYSRVKFLSTNVLLTAVLYGIFIWLVMNLGVVRLSNTQKSPTGFKLLGVVKSALILIFMIGLPLSVIMKNTFQISELSRKKMFNAITDYPKSFNHGPGNTFIIHHSSFILTIHLISSSSR